ncbi:hypothetical protein VD0002_g3447 [Verticillium dahliae]|uniref:Uncharacterized protein n=1 Tax=Verticillium dahliae TaxID=27337 RepID=A0A2J8C657_VERDA|nr:hypothetical protein BJF96_g4187 [Verticillium dahliae]PNH43084.1 hypothetical protein VD0004_g4342 [Verticillium dahliae]PNH53173.1 hypothetical protein VD0003_g4236 [Verticillium dahliae]PNH65619.1 hypothetical protein VD0002_g3447 [Verticillium dahliae]PNH71434.1 hypothetical protein VD0001_g6111 [Verticillium dahliae]
MLEIWASDTESSLHLCKGSVHKMGIWLVPIRARDA